MKALGIDIGTYSIKVAELDVSGKGYQLANFMEFPLSMDPSRDRGLEIIETLRNLSAQYDPSNTRWAIGIPQSRVSVHFKRFPFRERPKILKSLAFELEDEIPLDIDDTIFDAKIIEYVGEAADVLTVASPKEAIEEILSLAKDGGFDPDIVSVEGLAASNCFENLQLPPPDVSPALRSPEDPALGVTTAQSARVVLNIGHTRSLLLVYREGGLIAARSILWGGADIADAIGRAFSIPFVEAVKVLQTKSFILMNSAGASKDQLLMSKTVSDSVDTLMREMRLTLLEVKSNFNLEFKQIDLFGGVSLVQNLGPYVTQALEVPANIGHHLQDLRNNRVQPTPHLEAVSSVALGLALEIVKKPRNPALNLRKDEFARENKAMKIFWEKWRTAVQVAAIAFAILIVYGVLRQSAASHLIEAVDQRLSDMASNLAGLKGARANDVGVSSYIRSQKTKIKNREALMQLETYNSAMDILARLSEKLPVQTPVTPGRGLDISKLTINNDDIVIEGRFQGNDLLPRIESALNEVARPKTVKKGDAAAVPPGPGTPFSYTMKVNRK